MAEAPHDRHLPVAMKVLFIHQNFPGQYLHLAQHMRSIGGHEIIGLGEAVNIKRRGSLYGITTIGYPTPEPAGEKTHHYLQSTEAAVRRGQAVARALINLREKGFTPDVISVHPGWGEGLFIRDVYPNTPVLMFCEYFFQAGEADLQFDPEFPYSLDWCFSVRIRNAAQLLSLPSANACISPTQWQASRYPAFIRQSLQIIHDGIDTGYMHPDPATQLVIQPLQKPGESRVITQGALVKNAPAQSGEGKEEAANPKAGNKDSLSFVTKPLVQEGGTAGPDEQPKGDPLVFSRGDKVITYIARNLEPYRGFHVFLRALPEVQRRHPDAHILIVGADGVSYSPALPGGQTYKEKYLAELGGALDLSRIHFLGRVPYIALRALFRVSSAHVYLTYPFVLSWSMLEAMSCESLLIASRTAPVEEVITHNENGLLVDFFDRDALVESLDKALASPAEFENVRKAARETVLQRFDLAGCLMQQVALLQALADGKYPNHF